MIYYGNVPRRTCQGVGGTRERTEKGKKLVKINGTLRSSARAAEELPRVPVTSPNVVLIWSKEAGLSHSIMYHSFTKGPPCTPKPSVLLSVCVCGENSSVDWEESSEGRFQVWAFESKSTQNPGEEITEMIEIWAQKNGDQEFTTSLFLVRILYVVAENPHFFSKSPHLFSKLF